MKPFLYPTQRKEKKPVEKGSHVEYNFDFSGSTDPVLHLFRSLSEADCLQDVGSPTNRPKLNVAKHATHHAHLQSSGKNNDRCKRNAILRSFTQRFTNVIFVCRATTWDYRRLCKYNW